VTTGVTTERPCVDEPAGRFERMVLDSYRDSLYYG
jgi:hypothetical protein